VIKFAVSLKMAHETAHLPRNLLRQARGVCIAPWVD